MGTKPCTPPLAPGAGAAQAAAALVSRPPAQELCWMCPGAVLDVSKQQHTALQDTAPVGTNTSHLSQSLSKCFKDLCDPWPCSTCNELALQMGTDRFSLHHLIKQTGKGRLFACANSCFTKYNIHRQTGDKQRMQRWKSPPLGFYLMGSAAHSSLRNQRDICLMTR